MRKPYITAPLALALALALGVLGLTGCSAAEEEPVAGEQTSDEAVVIKVGASPTPHAEILEQVVEDLAAEGFELEIIEYTDYVLPNTGVEAGEIDANYFQHTPYLDDFNAENGTSIVSAASIHFEPLGLYGGKTDAIDDLADGAKIAVPNDATNEARALLLLEQEGLLTLKEGAGIKATVNDIAENPKNIEFVEVEAAAVPAMLADVDMAVINGNYALSAGISVVDALAIEASDGLAADTYANIVAVAEGNENDPGVQALVKALTSEKIRSFIEQEYNGSVVAVF
ncbi:MAG: MetQ/NlpA family ABC transporter substrate-binding protein [Coriobacteriia bacterium]|nr:MetQ/NlpA family ABC transporter substrate-binding protein [Coriobacteriia bacterium]